jgi:hypothetical protein
MPRFLVIYPEVGRARLNRVVLDTWKQVGRVLAEHPFAQFVDLRYAREVAQQKLAQVELERERRVAQVAAIKAERQAKSGMVKA